MILRSSVSSAGERIFLDDVRMPPDESWTLLRTSQETLAALAAIERSGAPFSALSLDHDLGPASQSDGASVAEWMAADPAARAWPGLLRIHTTNPVGRERILAALVPAAPSHVVIEVLTQFTGSRIVER